MEAGDLVGVAVAGRGKHNGSSKEVLGLPAVASVTQLIETTNVERSTREQNHGEGKLTDDESVAKALMTAASSHAARAALERVVYVESHREERWGKTEGDSGDERSSEGPAEHAPVEREHDIFAIFSSRSNREPIGEPLRNEDGAEPAGESQQERLGNQRAE